jgi:hypothetical protein
MDERKPPGAKKLASKVVEAWLAGRRFEVPLSQAPKWARDVLREWDAEFLAMSAAKRRKAARSGNRYTSIRDWQAAVARIDGLPRRQVRLFFAAVAGVLIRRLELDRADTLMVIHHCATAVDEICDGRPAAETVAIAAATAADSEAGRVIAPGEPSGA